MILFSLLLILFPSKIPSDIQNQIVFWNVGQGQWITAINSNHCYHFDVGGEFFNPNLVRTLCSKKENVIFFSHWDWDHIGLTFQLNKLVNNLCVAVLPEGKNKSKKKKFINSLPSCPVRYSHKYPVENLKFSFRKSKTANDLSHVFIYKNELLVPGDSPKKMEKLWVRLIQDQKNLKWLAVSHHGSRTSTSEEFLGHTKSLAQAIISARKKVYGHPHLEVLERLKKHGISALRTEEWGNIRIITRY